MGKLCPSKHRTTSERSQSQVPPTTATQSVLSGILRTCYTYPSIRKPPMDDKRSWIWSFGRGNCIVCSLLSGRGFLEHNTHISSLNPQEAQTSSVHRTLIQHAWSVDGLDAAAGGRTWDLAKPRYSYVAKGIDHYGGKSESVNSRKRKRKNLR